MDIFGLAFRDYMQGTPDGVIRVSTNVAEEEELPVAYFFRSYDQMPEWERLALNECRGRVLDVGAGAGSHALVLQDRGLTVCAIDLSAGAVEVMKARGVKDARRRDFFRFSGESFDTMLFLMNGAGMAASLKRLKNMLLHAVSLLRPGGCILMESTDLIYLYEEEDGSVLIPMANKYYGEVDYRLSYKEHRAKGFPWLFVDPGHLTHLAGSCGLQTEILYVGEAYNYLAKLSMSP